MAAVTVFVLMAAASVLFSPRRRPWPGAHGKVPQRSSAARVDRPMHGVSWPVRGRAREVSMPRLVRQLSALLASGRSGPVLWAALAEVLASEHAAGGRKPPGHAVGQKPGRLSAQTVMDAGHPTIALVLAVQRASTLGLSTADAVSSACRRGAAPPHGRGSRGIPAELSRGQVEAWLDLAACLRVCEASGAPVAAVLSRLADRLETEEDTAELRDTALAGPRATVRLLTGLPFVGLGLGMAMGVDPFVVLLGSPLGWACLGSGLALVTAGRWWSQRLVSAAARPPSHHAGATSRDAPINGGVATDRPARTVVR